MIVCKILLNKNDENGHVTLAVSMWRRGDHPSSLRCDVKPVLLVSMITNLVFCKHKCSFHLDTFLNILRSSDSKSFLWTFQDF